MVTPPKRGRSNSSIARSVEQYRLLNIERRARQRADRCIYVIERVAKVWVNTCTNRMTCKCDKCTALQNYGPPSYTLSEREQQHLSLLEERDCIVQQMLS